MKALVVLLAMMPFVANAAEVLWGSLLIDNFGGGKSVFYLSNNQSANISVVVEDCTDICYLYAELWDYPEICNAWYQVEPGTVVDKALVENTRYAFHRNNIFGDGKSSASVGIFLEPGESVYFGFAYAPFDTPMDVRYGWAEIGLGDDLGLYVIHSATDLDGDPITVGSIPEPSSTLLIVLGLSVMALRRRKGMCDEQL